ncbi:hypothetical protein LCGC14_1389260 [marine sediment metagenome]|uniref:Uncharacterized protein n=1 Tax=marine sediment metagenome TaxID=412755 RepID=A0A0F9N200_9ZZZZ
MDIKDAVEITKLVNGSSKLKRNPECNLTPFEKEALQTLIDFYKEVSEVHEKVMDEKCASDEIHCTCVPVLREEIKRLRQTLIDSTKKIDELRGALDRAHKIFGVESDKLKKEFGAKKIDEGSRKCTKCKEVKSATEFYLTNRATGCLASWCKNCMRLLNQTPYRRKYNRGSVALQKTSQGAT